MTSIFQNDTFASATRVAFTQYLRENPNNRRVSQSDKEIIIEWLTNPYKRPSTQEDFSRRNYVRKSFTWDEKSQTLRALSKKDVGKDRTVITTDRIADVVEMVHKVSGDRGHGGWDATWKDISTSYYGILRSDVIFLLKKCQLCDGNPSKRPKGSTAKMPPIQQTDHEFVNLPNYNDLQCGESVKDIPRTTSNKENNFGMS